MRSIVVRNYIDNRIMTKLHEGSSYDHIIGHLEEKIKENQTKANRGKYLIYMDFFCKKRISDILMITSNSRFENINTYKFINLMKLHDKLTLTEDIINGS